MNDNDYEFNIISQNQLLQNIPTSAVGPGRVAPPITTTSPPLVTNPNNLANQRTERTYRRYLPNVPTQYGYTPNLSAYGGAYNNYPYRGMSNLNMSGLNSYGAYGQPTINGQYRDPIVNAAAESSRPAFESIQAVVQSFNSVSMMLESTFTAMHMSFQALLSVAENFTRLKMFMMKLYSTIVSFKLARWFLTKLFYLLRMVRGGKGSNAEEDVWTALSSTNHNQTIPSDGRSWPLVVFSGLLVATPYFVYKLLNSVTPGPVSANSNVINILPSNTSVGVAQCDWSNMDPKTIPLVKGKSYLTSEEHLASAKQTGWLLVDNRDGKRGYVPLSAFQTRKPNNDSVVSKVPGTSKPSSDLAPSNLVHGQVKRTLSTPITDVHGDPITLPHPSVNYDESNIGEQ